MIQPDYQILDITFLETEFKRKRYFDNSKEIKIELDVQKAVGIFTDAELKLQIVVDLTVTVKGVSDEEDVYTCYVSTTGVFTCNNPSVINHTAFANINAPAIIYPFIREYLAGIAMKAGFTLLVPPINFIKLHEEEKDK